MTTATVLYPDGRRESVLDVYDALDRLNTFASDVLAAAQIRENLQKDLDDQSQCNPQFAKTGITRVTRYLATVLTYGAVWAIDVILFKATAEFYARQAYANSPVAVELICLILPAAFLLLDDYIAGEIQHAHDDMRTTFRRGPYVAKLLVGAVFAGFMPASVIATQLAARPQNLESIYDTALNWQLGALAIVSLVSHSGILFAGHAGRDAKAWVVFAGRRAWLRHALRASERHQRRAKRYVQRGYTAYLALLEVHNGTYLTTPLRAGPFPRGTREVLNDQAGYELFHFDGPVPSSAANTAVPPPENPIPVPADAHHSDVPPNSATSKMPPTEQSAPSVISNDNASVRDADSEVEE